MLGQEWATYRAGGVSNAVTAGDSSVILVNAAGSPWMLRIIGVVFNNFKTGVYAGIRVGWRCGTQSYTSGGTGITLRTMDSSKPASLITGHVSAFSGTVVMTSLQRMFAGELWTGSIENSRADWASGRFDQNLMPRMDPPLWPIVRPGEAFSLEWTITDANAAIGGVVYFQATQAEEGELIDRFDTLNERMAEVRDKIDVARASIDQLALQERNIIYTGPDGEIIHFQHLGP